MDNYDIFSQICKHLCDQEKINLTAITTMTNYFKYKLIYVDQIDQRKIYQLPIYDNFESILINYVCNQFPKNIRRVCIRCYNGCIIESSILEFIIPMTVTHLTLRLSMHIPQLHYGPTHFIQLLCTTKIPNSVTYLKFGTSFNQPIKKNWIPNSITHLIFGHYFDQSIKDCIPNSVEYLKFGYSFNQPIKNCIPNSVTHLRFGKSFNQSIKDCMPSSVTHLRFGEKFNQSIKDCIPNSVTHLSFDGRYFFRAPLPSNVTHLEIDRVDKRYHKKIIGEDLIYYKA